MDNRKISFGFSKTSKKPNIFAPHKSAEENKVELIDCLEGQAIKIKNATEKEKTPPLEISVREDARSLLDRVKAIRNKQQEKNKDVGNSTKSDERPSNFTLDELAAQALIKDAQNWEKHKTTVVSKIQELPLVDDKLVLEGASESTIEDYEKVPIVDYGLAMLRGMGWKEGAGIGKNAKIVTMDRPECRPKGLGLGANKMIKNKQKTTIDKDGNELILKQNAYAKIIAGNHQGEYGQVQSMDDENALVFLKTAIKGEVLKLNDIFLVPVTQEEYNMCSRVLNNKKYEEYKALSDKNLENQYRDSPDNEMDHSEDRGKGSKFSKKRSNDSDEKQPSHNTYREKGSTSQRRSTSDDSDDTVNKSRTHSGQKSVDPSSSRNNHWGRNNSRQHSESDSDSENGSVERKKSSCSKYQNDRKKGSASRYNSSEDNTDSSPFNRNRSHSRRRHGKNKTNDPSSNDSDSSSNDYRGHRAKSKSGKQDHSSCSSKLKAKHKKHKKKNRHTESSSNESGYENENRRRKNKTKCRHRRYSNEESEEHYKKNKKNKR